MLDLVLIAFVGLLLAMGLKRPFIWVLLFIYIDIVMPQKVGWSLVQMLPLSLMAFVAAFAGWLLLDSKKGSRITFRQMLIVALLAWCAMTTFFMAAFPEDAMAKWDWVWKSLVFAAFLPLTLRTKLRIEAAALVMALSIGAIIINGGMKTVLGGGGYGELRLLVDSNSGIYESSIISTAAIAAIPLFLWLAKHGTVFKPDWRVKLFAAGLIFSALLIPIGTSARTGLVCIAVLAAIMLRSIKYKFVFAGLGGIALLAAIPFLPQSYLDRMATIANPTSDQSASTRLAVWRWTVDYVKQNPLGGGFDAYRANSFTYQTRQVTGDDSNVVVKYAEVTDEARAYHSAFFEVLGEQGWPGLFLWLWLNALGLWHMERIRRMFGKREGGKDTWQWGLANSLQQAQVVYLVGALFVAIAFQPFIYMLIGLQCALWSYVQRMETAPKKARFKRPDGGAAASPSESAAQPVGQAG